MNESNYKQIAEHLKEADAVLIGASNGLSISEGFNIFANDLWFKENFSDFENKYGIHSIIEGSFYPYPTEEDKWKFWSRLIHLKSNDYVPSEVMEALLNLVKDKDYFVITSNAEDHFIPTGFGPERVFEVEGKFTEMRCSAQCSDKVYSSKEVAEDLVGKNASLPVCPDCGKPMEVNIAKDQNFFDHPQFRNKQRALQEFLDRNHDKKIAILELGIGARNQLIKPVLLQVGVNEPNSTYMIFNKGEVLTPPRIADRSIGIDSDIGTALRSVLEYL